MTREDVSLPPALTRAIEFCAPAIQWIGRVFFKWNRLEQYKMIPLDSPIEDAFALYGEPFEQALKSADPEVVSYTFNVSAFHEAVIHSVDGKIKMAVYWSSHSDPDRDLKFVGDAYGQGIGWDEVERGYLYYRKDEVVRLWCSAAPAIGVAVMDYYPPSENEEAEQAAPSNP